MISLCEQRYVCNTRVSNYMHHSQTYTAVFNTYTICCDSLNSNASNQIHTQFSYSRQLQQQQWGSKLDLGRMNLLTYNTCKYRM